MWGGIAGETWEALVCLLSQGKRSDIRVYRSSGRHIRESEEVIVPLGLQGKHNPGGGKGLCFSRSLRGSEGGHDCPKG